MFFIQRHLHTTLRCYAGFQRFTGIKKPPFLLAVLSKVTLILCYVFFIRLLDLLGQQY